MESAVVDRGKPRESRGNESSPFPSRKMSTSVERLRPFESVAAENRKDVKEGI